MSKTPAFKDAPLGTALLGLIDALNDLVEHINKSFTAQTPVVAAIGSPTFPTAAAMATAATAAKTALAKMKLAIEEID
jgi:hypothetical protein